MMYEFYLQTLMEVPNDVILVANAMPLNVSDPSSCYCGNIARATLAKESGKTPADFKYGDAPWIGTLAVMERAYGDRNAWAELFTDANDTDSYRRMVANAWNERVRVARAAT